MTDKLHVLHVVGAMEIGGIENMLMTLMPYMKEKGIIFDFAVHGESIGVHEVKIKELGGKVYHLPRFVGVNIFSYLNAWRKLLSCHPELKIIHGHMTSTATLYLGMAKVLGRITIAHSHSTSTSGGKLLYAVKRGMEYPLRYLSDYLCACSADAADYRFGKGTSKRSNYHLWHNAIDTSIFRFSLQKRELYRKKLGVGESSVVIGHVGRMISAKNHGFLLEIFKEYQNLNSDSKLLLIGDGPLRGSVEKKIKELGLVANTILTGAVANTEDYLSAMDVFCFPSVYEGLPVSLIEAQTNERICLVSDVISREVKISNSLMFLSLSQSAIIWAEQIKKMLSDVSKNRINYNPYDVNVVSKEIIRFYAMIYVTALEGGSG